MTDLATLALAVDSRQVTTANRELDRFVGTGKRAENANDNLAASFRRTGQSIAVMQGPLGPIAGRLSSLATIIGGVGVVAGTATIAISGLTFGAYQAVQAFKQLEKEQATYDGVLRATGFAAGRTAEDIEDLAGAIRKGTLATEGDVRSAAAIMLTFRSVTGEAFDEAMKLSQDLAAVGFGSITSAATMMGKALEDPIQGIQAMRRVGVTFSESQKQIIQRFIETGQRAAAQRVILEGVRRQVGGAGSSQGESLVGAWNQLSEAVNNWLEGTGKTISKSLGIETAILGIANAIDAVNKNAAVAASPDGDLAREEEKLRRMKEGRDVSGRRNPFMRQADEARIAMQEEIVAAKRLDAAMRELGRGFSISEKEAARLTEELTNQIGIFDGVVVRLKEEGAELRKSSIQRAIDAAVKEASTGAEGKLSEAQRKQIEAQVRQNFYLKEGLGLLQQRMSLLGDLASVDEIVLAKMREVNKARADGVRLTREEVKAIRQRTQVEAEINRMDRRMEFGLFDPTAASATARRELELLHRAGIIGAHEMAAAQQVVNKRLKEMAERAAIARAPLEQLARYIADGSNATRQLDTLAVSSMTNFENSIVSVIDQTKTLKDAAKDMARSVISDIIRMTVRMQISIPIAQALNNALTGGGGGLLSFLGIGGSAAPTASTGGGAWTGGLGSFHAKGDIFDRGSVTPFAFGGIVNRPTIFPMANGAGLMGEAGPEAIMPLRRGPNGKLGVEGGGGGTVVQIIDQRRGGAPIEEERSIGPNGEQRVRLIVRDEIDAFNKNMPNRMIEMGIQPNRKR